MLLAPLGAVAVIALTLEFMDTLLALGEKARYSRP